MNLEEIKRKGSIKELKDQIEVRQFKLTNRNWEGIKKGSHYTRLGEAINEAHLLLTEMTELLEELQTIEQQNT